MQKYLLNRLKIRLWDCDNLYNLPDRYYHIIVEVKLDSKKKKIYESKLANSVITIKFPDQFVEEF